MFEMAVKFEAEALADVGIEEVGGSLCECEDEGIVDVGFVRAEVLVGKHTEITRRDGSKISDVFRAVLDIGLNGVMLYGQSFVRGEDGRRKRNGESMEIRRWKAKVRNIGTEVRSA